MRVDAASLLLALLLCAVVCEGATWEESPNAYKRHLCRTESNTPKLTTPGPSSEIPARSRSELLPAWKTRKTREDVAAAALARKVEVHFKHSPKKYQEFLILLQAYMTPFPFPSSHPPMPPNGTHRPLSTVQKQKTDMEVLVQLQRLFQGHDDLLNEIALTLNARLPLDLADPEAPALGKMQREKGDMTGDTTQKELAQTHVDFDLHVCSDDFELRQCSEVGNTKPSATTTEATSCALWP
jgi:hypothetical protein